MHKRADYRYSLHKITSLWKLFANYTSLQTLSGKDLLFSFICFTFAEIYVKNKLYLCINKVT